MKKKSTFIFAGIVFLTLAYAGLDVFLEKKQVEKKSEESKIFDLKSEEISKIEFSNPKAGFTLERIDNKWILVGIEQAEQNSVIAFINEVLEKRSLQVLPLKNQEDEKIYALDNIDSKILLYPLSKEVLEIKLSKRKNFEGNFYIHLGSRKEVLLVDGSWGMLFEKVSSDFRDKRLMRFDSTEIVKVEKFAKQKVFSLVNESNAWVDENHKSMVLDQKDTRELLSKLNQTFVQEFLANNKQESEKLRSKFGKSSPEFVYQVQLKNSKSWQAEFFSEGQNYVIFVNEPFQAIQIAKADVGILSNSDLQSLESKTLPFAKDLSSAQHIEVHLASTSQKFSKDDKNQWKQIEPALKDQNTDSSEAIQTLLDSVSKLRVKNYTTSKKFNQKDFTETIKLKILDKSQAVLIDLQFFKVGNDYYGTSSVHAEGFLIDQASVKGLQLEQLTVHKDEANAGS